MKPTVWNRKPDIFDPDSYRWSLTADFQWYDMQDHVLYLPNGTRCYYTIGPASYYLLTSIVDAFNNTVTLDYDAQGRLTEVHQNLGSQARVVEYHYDGDDVSIVYDGKTWNYDFTGDLLTTASGPIGPSWTFEYGTTGVAPFIRGVLTAVNTPQGGRIEYDYDARSFPEYTPIEGLPSPIPVYAPTTVVTARRVRGNGPHGDWSYDYAPSGLHTTITEPGSLTTEIDMTIHTSALLLGVGSGVVPANTVRKKNGVVIETEVNEYYSLPLTYQGLGMPAIKKKTVTRDGKTFLTEYAYRGMYDNLSDLHRPTQIKETGPGGGIRITDREYDYNLNPDMIGKLGKETVTANGGSFVSEWGYDYNTGFMTNATINGIETSYDKDIRGNIETLTDGNGHTTSYEYSWGVPSKMTPPSPGAVVSRMIDPNGTVASQTYGGGTTAYTYDDLQRIKKIDPPVGADTNTTYDDVGGSWVKVARDTTFTTTTVDGFGRVVRKEDAAGVTLKTNYDVLGRVIGTTLPFDGTHGEKWVTSEYDGLGRLISKNLPSGPGVPAKSVTYSYSGADVTITDEAGRITTHTRQAYGDPSQGWLTGVTYTVQQKDDSAPQQRTWSYGYNGLGSLLSVTPPAGSAPGTGRTFVYNAHNLLDHETHPETGTTNYTYDDAGQLIRKVDDSGRPLKYEYDAADRLRYVRDGGNAELTKIDYQNGSDRKEKVTTAGVTTEYTYDTGGRMLSRTEKVKPAGELARDFKTEYAFNDVDAVSTITYPDHRIVRYSYDVASRISRVWDDTPGGASVDYAKNFKYHPAGGVEEYRAGNQTKTIVNYVPERGWTKNISVDVEHDGGRPVPAFDRDLTFAYAYDDVGNVTGITGSYETQTFTYDALDRLLTTTNGGGNAIFQYDDHGNQHATGAQRVFNQLRLTSDSTGSYTYDGSGRLTQHLAQIYTYDAEGMMTRVTSGGSQVDYDYNADGERAYRLKMSGTDKMHTYFVHGPGGALLSELTQKNNDGLDVVRDYIYAGSRLLASAKPAAVTVSWDSAGATITEGPGTKTVPLNLKLNLLAGATLSENVTVTYGISGTARGTGTWHLDYTAPAPAQRTVTFLPGQTTIQVPIQVLDDALNEDTETIVLTITAVSGAHAHAGSLNVAVITILDSDPKPVLNLSGSISLQEANGPAHLTATLSAESGRDVSVHWRTVGNPQVCADYEEHGSTLITIPEGQLSGDISVILYQDFRANEPNESFLVQLDQWVNADQGVSQATVTIVDSDAPVSVPALPGQYLADVRGTGWDYLLLANPYASAVMTKVTLVFADGTATQFDRLVGSHHRERVDLHSRPFVGCEAAISAVVQSPDAASLIPVEHAGYIMTASTFDGGRSTEGVATASSWYFAEGNPAFGVETITAFNPNASPVSVTLQFHQRDPITLAPIVTNVTKVLPKLSRFQWNVGQLILGLDHGTIITASAPIAVNRTIQSDPARSWTSDGVLDSHSSSGTSTPSNVAYLAEGFKSPPYQAGNLFKLKTYLAVFNPTNIATTLNITYIFDNGAVCYETTPLGAYQRITPEPKAYMPETGFGYAISAVNPAVTFVAERMIYGQPVFHGSGSVGVAQPTLSGVRVFPEGATGGFDTFFLINNPSNTPATVTFDFYDETTGARVYRHTKTVPALRRADLGVNGLPGMSARTFMTVVSSSIPVVTERVSYWPGPAAQSSMAAMLSVFDPSAALVVRPGGTTPPPSGPFVPSTFTFDTQVTTTEGSCTPPPSGQPVSAMATAIGALQGVPWKASHLSAGWQLAAFFKGPFVSFVAASSSVTEGGSSPAMIKVMTSDGSPLSAPVTVSFSAAGTSPAPATAGSDFSPASGSLTIAANTASGTTFALPITIVQNLVHEPTEVFSVALTDVSEGMLSGQVTHDVTIYDDDLVTVSIGNAPAVAEGPVSPAPFATSQFTLSLSRQSEATITVAWQTESAPEGVGAAQPVADYVAASGTVTFLPGQTTQTVSIRLVDNLMAEQTETFSVRLTSAGYATIGQATGIGTVLDDERPRVEINPALPSTYFPDLNTQTDTSGYIAIFNPHTDVPVVGVRVIFTRPDGSGKAHDIIYMTPLQRITIDLGAEPNIQFQGDVSVVVQSLDTQRPVVADASSYWQADKRGGRTSRGVAGPTPIRYFSEGATGRFDEYITVFNPSNQPANVTLQAYLPGGLGQAYTYRINEGPGRIKIKINDLLPTGDHSFSVRGRTLSNTDLPVASERTMYWENASQTEGHSSTGLAVPTYVGYLAEGIDTYSTFMAVLNPGATATNLQFKYLHESGAVYTDTKTIAPYSRDTISPPASITWGTYATVITTTNSVPFVAERSLYTGVNWKVLDSSVATDLTASHWYFAEGATGYFHTYMLLGNPSTTAATVTLKFMLEGSTQVVTTTTTVGPQSRATVDLNGVPGLSAAIFATEVTVTNGVPIIAERTMYWPSGSWGAMHISRGRPW